MKTLSLLIVALSFVNPAFAQTKKPVAKSTAPAGKSISLSMNAEYRLVALNSTADKVKVINQKLREGTKTNKDFVSVATQQQIEDIVAQLNIPRDTVAVAVGIDWHPSVGKEAKPEFNGSKWFAIVSKEDLSKDLGVLIDAYNKHTQAAMDFVNQQSKTYIKKLNDQSSGAEL